MNQVVRLSFPGPSIAWVLVAVVAALLLAFAGGGGRAAAAADCRFVLGFKALHAMIPDTVGACLENEQHHPGKGVTLQRTKNGLLVWQKATNHTAFTDGYHTWVLGPLGLQKRLNTEQFDWERDAEKIIRIGAAVSATGRYVREGNDVRQGYRLWADWVHNEYGGIKVGDDRYRVELVLYDDEGDAVTAGRLVEKLISEDRVDFLLGPYTSGLTRSAIEVAEQHGKIMVEANGGAESLFAQGFQNLFAVLTPAGDYTQSALELLAAKGAKTVAIAHSETAFATSVAAGAERWAAEYGLEVLGVQAYPQGVEDVRGIISEFKELSPDVFVGGGHFNDALLFIRRPKNWTSTPGDGAHRRTEQSAADRRGRGRRGLRDWPDAVGSVNELPWRALRLGVGLRSPLPGNVGASTHLPGGRCDSRGASPASGHRGGRLAGYRGRAGSLA